MNILLGKRLGMLKTSAVAAACLTLMSFLVACGGGAGSANTSSWEKAITPPKLTGISPASGPTTGGTTVAITGTDFQQGATVVFGNVPAAKINSVTSTSIEAVTPVHDAGNVDVTVTNPDTRSDTLLVAFTFAGSPPPIGGPAPTISSVLPNSGPVIGGTVVTITGTDFQSGATVTFGQTPAAVVFSSATQLLATTPAHAQGIVDVIVRNPDTQSATVPGGFTYQPVPAPTIISLQPTSGPTVGGTLVSIAGTNFLAAATVSFGGEPATPVTVTSSTQIDTVTPAHAAGVVDVWVTNLDGQLATLASGFTYVLPPPTISGVSPTTGPIGGGTVVTIFGTNFQNGATVTFAGVAATSATVNSSTQIAATTPAHTAGTVDVRVTNPDNQSATLPGGFTYSSGGITAGCGAGTDNSDCGNVGDPYEGSGGPPSTATPITACGTLSPTSGQYFLVKGNIGSNATAQCINITVWSSGASFTLDLGGHTVTGYVTLAAVSPGPITVFNGTIVCSVDWNSTARACLNLMPDGQLTGQMRAHHLTVTDQYTTSGSTSVNVINGTPHTPLTFPGQGLGLEARVDHITIVSPVSTPYGTRFTGIYGAQYINYEADHNYVHCLGGVSAPQGILAWLNPTAKMHDNQVKMDYNTVADGRALMCDGAGVGSGNSCDIYSNVVTSTNNRAIRYRVVGTQNGLVYSNSIYNIQETGTAAAIHLGENDTNLATENIEIYSNVFELNGGQAIINCSATGANIHNNTVTCYGNDCSSASYFARTNVEGGLPDSGTAMTVKYTTFPSGWGGRNAVMACGPPGDPSYSCTKATGTSTVTYCDTGVVVGNGTITQQCP